MEIELNKLLAIYKTLSLYISNIEILNACYLKVLNDLEGISP